MILKFLKEEIKINRYIYYLLISSLYLISAYMIYSMYSKMTYRKTNRALEERRHQELLEAVERQKLQKEEMEK